MSLIPESVRALVVDRAKSRCEYCRLPILGQVARFPIDHIIPRNADGQTTPDNLALACPHCNAFKWAHTQSADPQTGLIIPLFHPRADPWSEHFRWSRREPTILEGITPKGRATVSRLQMNHPNLVTTRALLMELGLFPDLNA